MQHIRLRGSASAVCDLDGSQHGESRAAEHWGREVLKECSGRSHAGLSEHDDIDVIGEAADVTCNERVVAGVVAALEQGPSLQTWSVHDNDSRLTTGGTLLEQLPCRGQRRFDRGEDGDVAAERNGALDHGPIDAQHGNSQLGGHPFGVTAESGAGAHDDAGGVLGRFP